MCFPYTMLKRFPFLCARVRSAVALLLLKRRARLHVRVPGERSGQRINNPDKIERSTASAADWLLKANLKNMFSDGEARHSE